MKILVVDDEISALQVFLSEIINEREIETKFLRDDPIAACNYVATNNVGAAFLDINMPGINGIKLAQQLIDINPAIRIIFITGLVVTYSDLPEAVAKNTVGFLYKPYNTRELNKLLELLQDKKRVLIAKMLGSFDCFIDGALVNFSSSKSKELFALLLSYNGKSLTMNDSISHLWADVNLEKSKTLYRDAVWRLRKTLREIDYPCVIFRRAVLSLNKSLISCDYWDYLLTAKGNYNGEFCKNYDWSIDYLAELDAIANKKS